MANMLTRAFGGGNKKKKRGRRKGADAQRPAAKKNQARKGNRNASPKNNLIESWYQLSGGNDWTIDRPSIDNIGTIKESKAVIDSAIARAGKFLFRESQSSTGAPLVFTPISPTLSAVGLVGIKYRFQIPQNQTVATPQITVTVTGNDEATGVAAPVQTAFVMVGDTVSAEYIQLFGEVNTNASSDKTPLVLLSGVTGDTPTPDLTVTIDAPDGVTVVVETVDRQTFNRIDL